MADAETGGNGRPRQIEELLAAAGDSAGSQRTLYVTYLLFGLYLLVVSSSITDLQLLRNEAIAIPLMGDIKLSATAYFGVAPWLFLLLHFELLLHSTLFAGKLQRLDDLLRQEADADARRQFRRRLADTALAAWLVGDGALAWVASAVVWVTLFLLPLLVLLAAQVAFLPYHSALITNLGQRLPLALMALSLLFYWPRLAGLGGQPSSLHWWGKALASLFRTLLRVLPRRLWRLPGGLQALWRGRRGAVRALLAWPPRLPRQAATLLRRAWAGLPVRVFTHERGRWRWRGLGLASLALCLGFGFHVARLPGENLEDDPELTRWLFDDGPLHRNLQLAEARLVPVEDKFHADFQDAQGEQQAALLRQIKPLDLRGRDLRFADLDKAFLAHADLREARLQGASLVGALLQGASLEWAYLQGANLDWALLQGVSLFEAGLQGASLSETQLQGARLVGARLQGAFLGDAQLQGASLDSARLQGVRLNRAQLQGANLEGAQLQGASFIGARIWSANFSGATWGGNDLRGVGNRPMAKAGMAELKDALASLPAKERQAILAHAGKSGRPATDYPPKSGPCLGEKSCEDRKDRFGAYYRTLGVLACDGEASLEARAGIGRHAAFSRFSGPAEPTPLRQLAARLLGPACGCGAGFDRGLREQLAELAGPAYRSGTCPSP